jgi:hypothetical protein
LLWLKCLWRKLFARLVHGGLIGVWVMGSAIVCLQMEQAAVQLRVSQAYISSFLGLFLILCRSERSVIYHFRSSLQVSTVAIFLKLFHVAVHENLCWCLALQKWSTDIIISVYALCIRFFFPFVFLFLSFLCKILHVTVQYFSDQAVFLRILCVPVCIHW